MLLAFLDFRRKVGGLGPLVTPSGDIEADMKIIREFFANVTPKHPELASPPVVQTDTGPNAPSGDR
jgi:hypothetical protein